MNKNIIEQANRFKQEVKKIIIGQDEVIDLLLIPIIAKQHALIEGVPGVAKTLLVKTLAKCLSLKNGRIQFTPDLMPSDITGTNVFSMKNNEFEFIPGPIFTTFLLADEINRAPAKTQSALLQAMQERTVSIDNELYTLDSNFTVFATQNPIEHEGTYPLPEAQKDRFMLKVNMGYPSEEEENALAQRMLNNNAPEKDLESGIVESILSPELLDELRNEINQIIISPELSQYIVKIIRKTRESEMILVGAGPRATQAMIIGCRIHAALDGRDYITPDDVKYLARPILSHRIILRPEYEMEGLTEEEAIKQILIEIPVPR
jgi:MoxR-like ATPase